MMERKDKYGELTIHLKFSNGQIDVVRCKHIGQANVVGGECSKDTHGTTRLGHSTQSISIGRFIEN